MALDRNKLEAIVSVEDLASRAMSLINAETMSMIGAFGGLGLVAGGLTAALVSVTKAAVEEEKQWHRLSISLNNARLDAQALLPHFQEMTDRMEEMSGVADTEISGAFTRMTRALIPVNAQQGLMNIALDAAAASGKTLGSVVDMLIKGQSGYTRELVRFSAELGISTKEGQSFLDIVSQIAEKTRGEAMLSQTDMMGQVNLMTTMWGRFTESLGEDFLVATNKIIGAMGDLFEFISGREPDAAEKLRDLRLELQEFERYREAWDGYLPPEDQQRYNEVRRQIDEITNKYKEMMKAESEASLKMLEAFKSPPANWNRILSEPISEELRRMNDEVRENAVAVAISTGKNTDYVEMLTRLSGVAKDLTGEFSKLSEAPQGLQIGQDVMAQIAAVGESMQGALSSVDDGLPDIMGNIRRTVGKEFGAIERIQGGLASSFSSSFFNLRQIMAGNWSGMAEDFIINFGQSILDSLAQIAAKAIVTFLWFDVYENDQMLIREGRKVATLMQQGITEGMRGFTPQIQAQVSIGTAYNGRMMTGKRLS